MSRVSFLRGAAVALCAALSTWAGAAGEGDSSADATGLGVELPAADEVRVYKAERRMELRRSGAVLRTYKISLGLSPKGHKERVGDFRTPEGTYRLTRRNSRSEYFLSIQISYPNEADARAARRRGEDPGGAIMVHGLPNAPRHTSEYYTSQDWTDGCIALSNSDMVEFWLLTQDYIPIVIYP